MDPFVDDYDYKWQDVMGRGDYNKSSTPRSLAIVGPKRHMKHSHGKGERRSNETATEDSKWPAQTNLLVLQSDADDPPPSNEHSIACDSAKAVAASTWTQQAVISEQGSRPPVRPTTSPYTCVLGELQTIVKAGKARLTGRLTTSSSSSSSYGHPSTQFSGIPSHLPSRLQHFSRPGREGSSRGPGCSHTFPPLRHSFKSSDMPLLGASAGSAFYGPPPASGPAPSNQVRMLDLDGFSQTTPITIASDIVKASDIMKKLTRFKSSFQSGYPQPVRVCEVATYAFKEFIMDEDIEMPGINLVIIAPAWNIDSNRVIDLSGHKGRKPDPKPETPETPNHHHIPPSPGVDGKPGHPGQSSGNLMIIGLADNEASKLTVKLNGGDGGDGQDAGDGATAAPYAPAKMTINPSTGEVFNYTHKRENYREEPCYRVELTEVYARSGGASGFRGAGGLPGLAGTLLKTPRNINRETKYAEMGRLGEEGEPGYGNKGYIKYLYVAKRVLTGREFRLEYVHSEASPVQSGRGEQISEPSPYQPESAAPSKPIIAWRHIIHFMRKLKETQTAVIEPRHTTIEGMSKSVEFFIPNTFEEMHEMIHQLTLEELAGVDKLVVAWHWQTFIKGVEVFMGRQKEGYNIRKAQHILGAINSKMGYKAQPAQGLDSTGPPREEHNHPYVWNLEGCVELLQSHLTSLKRYRSQARLSHQKKEYAKRIDQKIVESKRSADELNHYLDKAIEDIDKGLKSVYNHVKGLIKTSEKNIETLKEQIKKLKILAGFKIAFSVLKLVIGIASVACPAIAPIGAIAICAMDVATSIAESSIKEGDIKQLDINIPSLSFKDTLGFRPDKQIKDFRKEVNKLKPIKDRDEYKQQLEKLRQLREEWETDIIDEKTGELINRGPYPTPLSDEEFLELEKSLRKKEMELEQKVEEWEKAAKMSKTVIEGAKNTYNTIRSTFSELKEMKTTQTGLEKQLEELKGLLTSIDKSREDIADMGKNLNIEIQGYSDRSFSELVVLSSKFINKLDCLSTQCTKLQEGLKIETKLGGHIETVRTMYRGIVDIYKHIAQYKDHKVFAAHVADLHMDGKYDDDINAINELLETNYFVTQHFNIVRTIKAHLCISHGWTASYVHRGLAEFHDQGMISSEDIDAPLDTKQLLDYMENNKIFIHGTYIHLLEATVTGVRDILQAKNCFILVTESMIKHNVEYQETYTYEKHPEEIDSLMNGKSVKVSIPASNCPFDLYAIKDVRLSVKHEKREVDMRLQPYLSTKMEAVLTKTGVSEFKVVNECYRVPLSCPPKLTHEMDIKAQGSCNDVLQKLKGPTASPTLSPFGGEWEIGLKVAHRNEIVNFLHPEKLNDIFPSLNLTPHDFLIGLKVSLHFTGQAVDLSVYPSPAKNKWVSVMKSMLSELQA